MARDLMCESCGSSIQGQTDDDPHLCSIRSAKGWRQEIPLHLRRRPLRTPTAKIAITDRRDWDLYQKWVEEHHHEADALVVDKRTGLVIQAIYDCPVGMDLAERLDLFVNIGKSFRRLRAATEEPKP